MFGKIFGDSQESGDSDALTIGLRTTIIGEYSGIRFVPFFGFAPVAVIGLRGITTVKRGQKIINMMALGNFVQMVISAKTCRFKKEKDAGSIDLYRAYQRGEKFIFSFSFSVQAGDYIQKALFTVSPTKIIDYHTDAKPVLEVKSSRGLEAIEFEFETASVDYVKELDSMFLIRVEQQRKKIIRLTTKS